MEAGGIADKVGGRYEDLWGVRLLLRILEEDLRGVVHEPAGTAAGSGDYRLDFVDHRELHQCKEGNGFSGRWSLVDLASRGVLVAMRDWLDADAGNRYCFVSGDPAPELRELLHSATNSEDAVSFYEDQVKPVRERRDAFHKFCGAVRLSPETADDREKARDLLRRCDVHLFADSDEEKKQLKTQIRFLVDGDPDAILGDLRDWINRQLRASIYFSDIQAHLGERFPLCRIDMDPRVGPVFERLNDRFRHSLVPFLVGDRLLPRGETQQVLEALARPEVQVVVVHGIAGSGKSGVSYELTEILAGQGTPYLAFRLDQDATGLKGSTTLYGRSLGLPESPALCLRAVAGPRPSVLVVDQLDALRWTTGHSGDAWQICRELIAEAVGSQGMTVVVCCRTYDLRNDPLFTRWVTEISEHVPIEVRTLDVDTVRGAVERAGGQYDLLRPVERRLLSQVQNLRTWSEVFSRQRSSPRFDSERGLLHELWKSRYDALAREGIVRARVDAILDALVDFMNREGLLNAPLSTMGASGDEERTLQSLQILVVAGDRVHFGHQSHLDFLVARWLLKEMGKTHATVLAWLGGRERQSLLLREQLRLVLGLLRDERPASYVGTLRELLVNSEVRFHLKQLALSQVGQITDPRPDEVALMIDLVDEDPWRSHVLGETVAASSAWFEVLMGRGRFEAWLSGDDDRQRAEAVGIMRRHAPAFGDEVARLLAPYATGNLAWTELLARVFPTKADEDSDALFALRLHIAERRDGHLWYHDWASLAKRSFRRLMDLVLALLEGRCQKARAGSVENRDAGFSDFSWPDGSDVDFGGVELDLLVEAFDALSEGVERLRRILLGADRVIRVLEVSRLDLRGPRSLLNFLRALAGHVAVRHDGRFAELLYGKGSRTLLGQIVLMEVLAELPDPSPALADAALSWLQEESGRLHLQREDERHEFGLSGKLVAHLSVVCSDEAFARLETFLLKLREPDLLAAYRWTMEVRQEAKPEFRSYARPSIAGVTQYHLLPRLPPARRSQSTERVVQELRRKFDGEERDSSAGEKRAVATSFHSPIAHSNRLERLSDRSWLAMARHKLPQRLSREDYLVGERRRGWSSLESYKADFETIASRQPERFARLALRLPETADPRFLAAIVTGLGRNDSRTGVPPREEASQESLEALFLSPQVRGREDLAKEYCAILEDRPEVPWSDSVLHQLVEIALLHPDPKPGHFPVGTEADDDDRLSANVLNTSRGRVGFVIHRILFDQPERLELLRPAIEALVADPHPVVRVGAIMACLPVMQSNRELAISWFIAACHGYAEVLGTDEAFEFLKGALLDDLELLQPILESMVRSARPLIAARGANLAAACFLQTGRLQGLFDECVGGSVAQRQGVAERAGFLLARSLYHEAAKRWVLRLANDEAEEVHRVLERTVTVGVLALMERDPGFARDFAGSRAVESDAVPLLTALGLYAGSTLTFASCILRTGRVLVGDGPTPRAQSLRVLAEHTFVPLLLRLYEQAQAAGDSVVSSQCLDLWDVLLERRRVEAVELMSAVDKG